MVADPPHYSQWAAAAQTGRSCPVAAQREGASLRLVVANPLLAGEDCHDCHEHPSQRPWKLDDGDAHKGAPLPDQDRLAVPKRIPYVCNQTPEQRRVHEHRHGHKHDDGTQRDECIPGRPIRGRFRALHAQSHRDPPRLARFRDAPEYELRPPVVPVPQPGLLPQGYAGVREKFPESA